MLEDRKRSRLKKKDCSVSVCREDPKTLLGLPSSSNIPKRGFQRAINVLLFPFFTVAN
jgi:hypothetical protein